MARSWVAGLILGLVGLGAAQDARADRAVVAVGALTADSPSVPAAAAEAARAATRSAQWTVEDGVPVAKQREALECLEDTKTAGACVKRVFEDGNTEADRVVPVAA